MRLVADLHLHSRFSRATSPKLNLPRLERWASIKGLDLVGTGDCTHPAWLAELEAFLEPAEEGLYALREEPRREFDSREALVEGLPAATRDLVGGKGARFVVSGEISTIYSRGGRTRKVHHVVLLPGLEAAKAFQARLGRVGNISSDGRPILGLDSRDLFELLMEADERSILVPAHVWTPWFSALGERSGFDSIDECYGDLAPRIGAIETGLSSNPPMNWALSSLDRFAVVSSSDAHSPDKLGREATLFDIDLSYSGLAAALRGGGSPGEPPRGVAGTVEFFPQEGKYHYDGHRACGVRLEPGESAARGGLCPVCGKALTPGVMGRVAALADRPVDEAAPCPQGSEGTNRRPYRSLIPLDELLGELLDVGPGSKRVAQSYNALISAAGSELSLLMGMPLTEIERLRAPGLPGELLAQAVGRMRSGQVIIEPGYDGEYGRIRVFGPGEKRGLEAADGLFAAGLAPSSAATPPSDRKRVAKSRAAVARDEEGPRADSRAMAPGGPSVVAEPAPAFALDPDQESAVAHGGCPALVIAGPGSGKTAVLALRAARLLESGLAPDSILALSFTNKAAESLRERIARAAGPERAHGVLASTFHSFCRALLADNAAEAGLGRGFAVMDEEERYAILEGVAGKARAARRLGDYVEARKRFLMLPGEAEPRLGPGAPSGLVALARELGLPEPEPELDRGYAAYRAVLKGSGRLDFDDLVAGAARLLSARPDLLAACRSRYRAILVDEYQDLNFAQYALMRLLAPAAAEGSGPPADLFVIGDPNQAIYGFRGSDRRFIERFREDYPGAAEYRLRRSFRCAAPILGAAGSLVGARLDAFAAGEAAPDRGEVALYRTEYPTDKSEAEGVARQIDRLIGGTGFFARDSGVATGQGGELRSLGECAILVRAAALAECFEKALADHGIPYRLVDEPSQEGYEPRTERVWIMTMHASKGLEFDQVFVAGLEEGILPFTLYDEAGEDGAISEERVEEERRILYVAMTRARVGLRLSWARKRSFKGRELEAVPSRFLAEIGNLVPFKEEVPPMARDPQLGLF